MTDKAINAGVTIALARIAAYTGKGALTIAPGTCSTKGRVEINARCAEQRPFVIGQFVEISRVNHRDAKE